LKFAFEIELSSNLFGTTDRNISFTLSRSLQIVEPWLKMHFRIKMNMEKQKKIWSDNDIKSYVSLIESDWIDWVDVPVDGDSNQYKI
jgi:hypothetical protein